MINWFRVGAALGACLAVTQIIHADVQTLPATVDSTLYSEDPNVANGAGDYFFAGRVDGDPVRRALIRFDVAGSIPAGSTINSVTLTLYMSRTKAGTETVTLHRVTQDWGEGASDAPENEGGPVPAEEGDATWAYRFFDFDMPMSSPIWMTTGGDFIAAPSASAGVGGNGFYTWGSTSGMVADVQMWVDIPASEFGWLLQGNEAVQKTAKRFNSRTSGQASRHPMLTIDFTPPAGSGACCFADTGTCQLLTSGECSAAMGSYQGDGTSCSPNPCPQPVGACCFSDGSCMDLEILDCGSQGGVFEGAGTTCGMTVCPVLVGACCVDTGLCSVETESDCTSMSGTYQGDGTTCLDPGLRCPVILEPFVDALPLPAPATPSSGMVGGVATYDIEIQQIQQPLHSDLPPTTLWGYDGLYPGPTVEASTGNPVTVNWINDLRDEMGALRTDHLFPIDTAPHGADTLPRTVVHLHGGHVPSEVDGYPEFTFLPGEMETYVYPNNQLPATMWYHDHALGTTRVNVMAGLAGFYLLRDAFEQGLGLPSGQHEVPLVIQDRTFNPDGSLHYPPAGNWEDMFFGDTVLVNGKVWPFLSVDKTRYRFRMLNGSNSRTYTLSMSDGTPFTLIGVDGGLLPSPQIITEMTLGPAERADVVVDFTGRPTGEEIILTNSAPAPLNAEPGTNVIPNIMKFIVSDVSQTSNAVPDPLRTIEVLDEADATVERSFILRKGADPDTGFEWQINDLTWDDVTDFVELGTTEIWTFANDSGMMHPMHVHLVLFQVLDRQPVTVTGTTITPGGTPTGPTATEQGWKDTVKVGPNEQVRVIARFEDYDGLFPYHCHILEHEDHEMMRQFMAIATGACCIDAPGCGDSCVIDSESDCLAMADPLENTVATYLGDGTTCDACTYNSPCDWNNDGGVNSDDYFAFNNDFFAMPSDADYNADGVTTSEDYFGRNNCFFTNPPGSLNNCP